MIYTYKKFSFTIRTIRELQKQELKEKRQVIEWLEEQNDRGGRIIKNNRLSIGQMAELNHTTLATLRLYDKMGLLSPAYVNPETGYRYYDVTQCAMFHLIQLYKSLNMSLKEIKSILDQSSYHFLLNFYHEKIAELDQELAALNLKRHTLKKIMEWTEFYQHRPPIGTFSLMYQPKHCVCTMPADRNYFQEDFGSLVYGVAKLKSILEQKAFPMVYRYTAFVSMKKQDFLQGTYRAKDIGILVGEEYQSYPGVEVRNSSLNVCICFDDFDKVHEYLDKTHAYCREQNYKIIGDAVCELVCALDFHDFRKSSEYLCLKVPVETQDEAASK